ncbi:hypothetical protein VXF94_21280 (plasmid) [Bacillus amyloliquefaciens]|uniref:hypothetical protein n=1 Tax=Bacillus amyloliquefaciens group TaxID=1938374 RepID=UPI001CD4DD28|nr:MULTISPECIES: hypothetical protein [Bacillus amyloliquefaciens group]MCV4329395.1 hypothetical protein [Bacillus velezensis]MDH3075856.1 hypothetical protein [Bacillus velezensis]MDH3104040.1 hypothetical protein [Bacillus velezensis]MDH3138973.1 hypothetical protein [Bacillus velezensis]
MEIIVRDNKTVSKKKSWYNRFEWILLNTSLFFIWLWLVFTLFLNMNYMIKFFAELNGFIGLSVFLGGPLLIWYDHREEGHLRALGAYIHSNILSNSAAASIITLLAVNLFFAYNSISVLIEWCGR